MSDNWVLCKKCGEELELVQTQIVNLEEFGKDKCEARYYCPNCRKTTPLNSAKTETTEYFNDKIPDGFGGNLEFMDKGEEDEKGNQSRRSKK